jgi:hypothetical protein
MAIGDPYATLDELKTYMSVDNSDTLSMYDAILVDVLDSSSREIETHCGRQFNKTDVATPREYVACATGSIDIDDFHTKSGLVIQSGPAYDAPWSATDFRAYPLNGIVNGQPGWPFWTIEAVGIHRFGSAGIQVTAQWGWEAVPAPVKQACLILCNETFNVRGAPLGVAGMDQFGAIRVRESRMAVSKLRRYVRNPILVG